MGWISLHGALAVAVKSESHLLRSASVAPVPPRWDGPSSARHEARNDTRKASGAAVDNRCAFTAVASVALRQLARPRRPPARLRLGRQQAAGESLSGLCANHQRALIAFCRLASPACAHRSTLAPLAHCPLLSDQHGGHRRFLAPSATVRGRVWRHSPVSPSSGILSLTTLVRRLTS